MKKINAIVCGVASIFSSASVVDTANIFKEYPTTHRKNVKEALQNSWITVGTAVKGAIDKYAEEVKNDNK